MKRIYDWLFRGKTAVWTATFTGVLTLFTFFLYEVTVTQSDNTKRTQRAFMSFVTVSHSRRIIDPANNRWTADQVAAIIKNGGLTPARSGKLRVNFELLPPDVMHGFDFRDSEHGWGPIDFVTLPQDSNYVTVAIPVETLDAVAHGQHLFVWGWATYRDVFKDTPMRLTEFCTELINVQFTGPVSDPKSDVSWQFNTCDRHICTDEDCSDYKERTKQ